MNRRITYDELRIAKTSKDSKVVAFAYDFDTSCAICAKMNIVKKSFHLMEIPIDTLTFYPLSKTIDLISDEKDPFGDLRSNIGYLTNVGLDETHWNPSWGIFQWDEMTEKGEVKVKKQLP
jgi:hypothetical protein